MMTVRAKVDLRPFNIWGVSGLAAQLVEPRSAEEFADTIRQAGDSIYIIGLGSNLLVLDEGFDGTVVVTHKHLRDLVVEEKGIVYAQCGVAQPRLARFLAKNSLAGGEFHVGIPGTVGGALAMNAGAFGGEIWDRVIEVDIVDAEGKIYSRPASEFSVSYRRVTGLAPGEVFLGARMFFDAGQRQDIESKLKEFLSRRNSTQPVGVRSCGSVFVNPLPHSAGRLIDQCGLKGFKIGDAQISTKHANFIINTGAAQSKDILGLVEHIQRQVLQQQRLKLMPEFRVLAREQQIPSHLIATE